MTGIAFPNMSSVALIFAVAFAGSLNPNSGDIGPLVPLEHAALAREAPAEQRTSIFARYSLVGALAAAAGSLAAGLPQVLARHGVSELNGLKAMFYLYAGLGLIAALLYRLLPLGNVDTQRAPPPPLGPSRGIVYRMAALFSVDAFAGGFVVQSLLALWLFERFDMSLVTAGVFFFWSGVLSAFSFPVAAGGRGASASSTRWSSRTSHRACA